jgi:hypothetical protein
MLFPVRASNGRCYEASELQNLLAEAKTAGVKASDPETKEELSNFYTFDDETRTLISNLISDHPHMIADLYPEYVPKIEIEHIEKGNSDFLKSYPILDASSVAKILEIEKIWDEFFSVELWKELLSKVKDISEEKQIGMCSLNQTAQTCTILTMLIYERNHWTTSELMAYVVANLKIEIDRPMRCAKKYAHEICRSPNVTTEIIEALRVRGADFNDVESTTGLYPIHIAAMKGHTDIVVYLLQNIEDVILTTGNGVSLTELILENQPSIFTICEPYIERASTLEKVKPIEIPRKIYVHTLGGKIHEIDASSDFTIARVKHMFNQSRGTPVNQTDLLFKGLKLKNETQISSLDAAHPDSQETHLHALIRLGGG